MLNRMVTKVKRTFTVIHFGLQILKWCGLRMFLNKVGHQLYGRTVFLVLKSRLDDPRPLSSIRYTTSMATPSDMNEFFHKIHHESPEGRYQLLVRKWYHERGFGDCYITRKADTGEICHVRWLVEPKHIKRLGWEDRFPLSEEDVMLENQYTFESCRRQGARTAAAIYVRKTAIQRGFKHVVGYNDENNLPQRNWSEKVNNRVYARLLERHVLFRVSRKIIERYDPPVDVAALKK